MTLTVMTIEEHACDGVTGDFTVVVWDHDTDTHYDARVSYFAKGKYTTVQPGVPEGVSRYIYNNPFLHNELREMVLAERDGLEEDAKKARLGTTDATKVFDRKPVNPAFNIN